jgi:hypothetical protein
MQSALLTLNEAAAYLAISRATLYRLRDAGRFPAPVGIPGTATQRSGEVRREPENAARMNTDTTTEGSTMTPTNMLRIYAPRPKSPDTAEAVALRHERAGLLAGLAKLGSDVLGAKAGEIATDLLKQAKAVKRSA